MDPLPPRPLIPAFLAASLLLAGCANAVSSRETRRDVLVGPAESPYPDADRPARGADALARSIPSQPPRGAQWESPKVPGKTPDRLRRRPLSASPRAMESYPFLGPRPGSP
ncbi:MAG: hypothetical protein ACKO3N_08890 [Verrucomicrobiota bacterium]